MPGQFHEEVTRLATHALSALGKAGKKLRSKADDLGAEISKASKETSEDLKKASKTFKEETLPKIITTAENVGHVVRAHRELTARRAGAEIQELVRDPEHLEARKNAEFELAKLVVNQRINLHSKVRAFMSSEFALIKGIDNSDAQVKGVMIFPKFKDLELLRNDYIPFRIFANNQGLMCRVYEQNNDALLDTSQARYRFKEERLACPEDLFQLQINAQHVVEALASIKELNAYKEFIKTNK
jgi:hypothetical protein